MKLTKRQVIPFCAAVGCVLLCGVAGLVSSVKASGQITQQAAERWQGSGELPCAQVSIFANRDAGFDKASVDGLAEQVDAALKEASLEADEDGRLWYAAYSTPIGTMRVNGSTKATAAAEVTAVGGSFFGLHQFRLLDGTYLAENDLMNDRVVLDEKLAWQVFGSSKVSGMEIIADDRTYIVAGVIRPENNAASKTAYGDAPRMYISFSQYQELQKDLSAETWIGCYEAVLPNPVRGFAVKIFDEAMQGQDGVTVVPNSDRYSLSSRWKRLRHLKEMVVSADGIAYPYWENAARLVDFDTAVLLGVQIVLLIYPVIYLIRMLYKLYRMAEQFFAEKRKAHKRRFRTIPEETYEE